MAAKNILYWASGSPPCWRVQLALEEKGLSGYPNKLLSFEKKEHKSEEVLKLNPRGQVPTFVHEGHIINESLAILDYLERVYPTQGKKLLPDDHKALALVLQKKYEVLNLDKVGSDVIRYSFFNKPEDIDQAELQKRLGAFKEELQRWEEYLATSGTSHLAGNQVSLADVVIFPNFAIYVRFGLDLSKNYPNISKYYQTMVKEPAVEKTWPPHWKEGKAPAVIFGTL